VRQSLLDEMARDSRVFVLGTDVGAYGGAFGATRGLLDRFGPARVIDAPVSEAGVVGAAIGAAIMGMRPVVEVQYFDFISCALDLLVNYAATSRYRWRAGVPLVVRGPCGAGVHAGPFHSQAPEARLMHTPGLKVVAPSTPADAKGLLLAAIRDPDPVLFLEHKLLYRGARGEVPDGDMAIPIGKGRLVRSGRDVTVVAYGAMVPAAAEAAAIVAAQDGIEAEVLDLRSLLPLDETMILASVARTGKVIIVHEATRTCGPGAEVAALIAERAFERLDAPIVRVAAPDTPVPFSPPLEEYFLPNAEKIVQAIRALRSY
jgi:pyruvate/2-oxoglutarate/acetoin dehydrogenase E1 component